MPSQAVRELIEAKGRGEIPDTVCVYTSICEGDARWVDQYLAEVNRLRLPFVIYLDRCSDVVRKALVSDFWCRGFHRQDDPKVDYQECHKQAILDLVDKLGYDWAMSWDADETFERDAPEKLKLLDGRPESLMHVRWACLWDDPWLIRTDGIFAEGGSCWKRDRFHRLETFGRGCQWHYRGPLMYDPYPNKKGCEVSHPFPSREDLLVCLHWGYMSRELRLQHKARWDHNYGTALGNPANPYGTWEYICSEDRFPPEVVRHEWGIR